MKSRWIAMFAVGLIASLAAAAQEGTKKASAKSDAGATMKTLKEKASYSIGLNIGKSLKNDAVECDVALLVKGISDSLSGTKPALSDKEIADVMKAFQKEMEEKQASRGKELTEKNKKEGEAFLAENKKKEGVKTTASGLQYRSEERRVGKECRL